MHLKIQGGTAHQGGPPLCDTCRFATVIRGHRLRDVIVECARLSEHCRITFRVATCSAYADKRQPSIVHMEDIAWVLRDDRND